MVTPSIRPDNLDYHALAREKLALQLLLRERQEVVCLCLCVSVSV